MVFFEGLESYPVCTPTQCFWDSLQCDPDLDKAETRDEYHVYCFSPLGFLSLSLL